MILDPSVDQAILGWSVRAVKKDVVAECAKAFDVAVDRLALRFDAVFGELFDDFLNRDAVILVGFLCEDAGKKQKLQLAFGDFGHVRSLQIGLILR